MTRRTGAKPPNTARADRLRQLRGSRTQDEIADAIGVTTRAYQDWEKGLTISRPNLRRLAEYHTTTPEYIDGNDPQMIGLGSAAGFTQAERLMRTQVLQAFAARGPVKPEQIATVERLLAELRALAGVSLQSPGEGRGPAAGGEGAR